MIAFIRQTAHKRRCFYITPIIVYNRNTSFTLLFFTFLFSPLLVFSGFSPFTDGRFSTFATFSDALLFTVFRCPFSASLPSFSSPYPSKKNETSVVPHPVRRDRIREVPAPPQLHPHHTAGLCFSKTPVCTTPHKHL